MLLSIHHHAIMLPLMYHQYPPNYHGKDVRAEDNLTRGIGDHNKEIQQESGDEICYSRPGIMMIGPL